jgi:hypothetical protein
MIEAGHQNNQQANEPAPANSIYSIELRDKNFDNLTNGELVEWLDKELRLRGAEKFGFRKVVLAEKIDPASPSGMGGKIGRAPLSTVLSMMQSSSRLDWNYEFGVLTLLPLDKAVFDLFEISLDSPLLSGINFGDPDRNEVISAVWRRLRRLGFDSCAARSELVIYTLDPPLLKIPLSEPDSRAAYALDQIMRESDLLKIVEPPVPKEPTALISKPSDESHEKESNPEKTQK